MSTHLSSAPSSSSGRPGLVPFLRLLALCLLLLLPGAAPAAAQETAGRPGGRLGVLRITPAGDEVPVGRQIVIQFNRAVVPLGRMERTAAEVPVTIQPQLNCRWRWLNPSTLACNLDEQDALLPATSYALAVSPGIVDGVDLARPVHHRFTTELPRVTDAWFSSWLAPQLPETMVRFNLAMDRASLSAHLFYLAPGGRRIPAVVEADPDANGSTGENDRQRLWRVHPQQELPVDTPVSLSVEPGIASLRGKERGLEDRTIDTLTAIPAFRFLGIECTDRQNSPFIIEPGAPLAGQRRCLPSGGISLLFSAPVLAEDIQAGLQFSPTLVRRHADANPWDEVTSYSQLSEAYSKGKRYAVLLPESLFRAFSEYRLQVSGTSLKDQFGRVLAGDVKMSFATDHRAPDFALPKNMPVLEKGLDTEAHVWAVNLDELELSYETLAADGGRTRASRLIRPKGPRDASIPVPLGVREMIGGDSGLVQGHFSPRPEVPGKVPEETWFFAQVSPFQVHLKLGHHNSLVWVTDMQTGEPVPGVTVEVLQSTFEGFSRQGKALAAAVTGDDGVAEMAGTTEIDPTLAHVWADGREKPCLFLRCRKGGDMAVLPVRYEYQVASEGANREYIPDWLRPLYGHIHVWGATAQGVYKAGDTVQYKIYVRDQDNLRFTRPPGAGGRAAAAAGHPAAAGPGVSKSATGGRSGTTPPARYHLAVEDPMGKVIHEQDDIVLSRFGAVHGEVALPENGAVGWYRFVLKGNFSKEEWQPIRVLVSDFTPSPFKVGTDLNGEHFQTGDTVEVNSEAKLHAGGPYTEAATRVTATLEPQPLQPDRPDLSGFQFDIAETKDGRMPEIQTLSETEGNLDEQGRMGSSFTIAETPVWYGRLTVESSVRDDRGKSVANRTSAICFGRDRYVGVLQQDWTLRQDRAAKLRLAVIDQEGAIVSGVPISVTSEYEKTWGARVKGAGDGYLTQYQHSWQTEQQLQGVSGPEPLELDFTPAHAGRLRLTAVIKDSQGRRHSTVIERWVTGAGVVLWESTPGNLLNVFAEKNGYTVGETARFFVQNPFPGARALITVERFGVIERWTKIFANNSEIIEIPVLPDYLPGFYLSVTVTSPRVEKPPGPQGEDLGKPTSRMGYVKVPVKDPYKELRVDIKPAKALYKPGDEVRVDLQVSPKNLGTGEAQPPVELAVAVLDEAVFDLLLQGSKAFDPYQGFYSLDELDLSNYNLLMQLVGREKLALKGASSGGGGGPDLSMRSLFKFVSYWNPSLLPDAEGRANIRFRVPDNLTGWRVLAMAVTPEDRMGLGEAVFQVNQSTEIRPVLPNQVLEGDQFAAGFALMNRTDKARSLEVAIKATGPVKAMGAAPADKAGATMSEKLTAQPYQRLTLRFPLEATGSGQIQFAVSAGDALDRDGLRQSLPVGRRWSQEVAASYGMTSEAAATEEVLFPRNLREDSGSLSLEISPSVIGGIDGAFAFLRDYPYGCWEQKLGRAVMAAMYGPLKPYLRAGLSWPASARTAGETLAMAVEHQAPNGGMVYYIAKDEHASPYLSAFTLLSFNWLRQQGYRPPEHVERRLQGYLLNLLRHDAAPESYSKGMTATVRAIALAALAESGKVKAADVERFRGQLPAMSLFGRSFYLKALLLTGAPRAQQQAVLAGILAHANEAPGGMVFSESLDSGFQLLHSSPVRDNAAIMINLLAWLAANPADSSVGGMPVRLMRSLSLSRKGRDHWPNTQENLFVAKALVDYARLYEDQAPRLTVEARLDEESLGGGRFAAFTEPPLLLERPLQAGDAGRRARLHLKKEGEGRLYYSARLAYSPAKLPDAAVNAGIEVHREYSVKRQGKWLLLRQPIVLRTGEAVRVDLYVSLPAERFFVVLDDPVPGGLEPVNRDLATASQQDAAAGEAEDYPQGSYWGSFSGWQEDVAGRWGFYHRELRHNAARFYSERLAAGRYHLSYSAQAISPGEFQVLPVHAEEMYAPDVYGNGMAQRLKIEAAQ